MTREIFITRVYVIFDQPSYRKIGAIGSVVQELCHFENLTVRCLQ